MTRYIIERREICPRCNGQGCYENPIWVEFYDDPDNAEADQDQDTVKLWMVARGYMHPGDDFPPDEIECFRCDGTGEITDIVNDAVFIAARGLVTRAEVDAMISEAFSNYMSAIELSPSRAEVQTMIQTMIEKEMQNA